MNSVYEKQLGHNIRALRQNCQMTQEQLSAKLQLKNCDITRSTLAKIEVDIFILMKFTILKIS